MEVYADGLCHCFGCGISVTAASLGIIPPVQDQPRAAAENIQEQVKYILSLPKAQIRGLELPVDQDSYYILWPDHAFYNRRFFEGTTKYKCPTGHSKRPLWAWQAVNKNYLCIVEGEINALSIARSCPWVSVMSPGGAGDFYSRTSDSWLPDVMGYGAIALICDEDRAGALAGIELKAKLLKHTPNVSIVLMKEDANDWLVKYGQKALAEEITGKTGFMDLSAWVPHY